ncbi:Lysosomal transcription factor, NCU-G1 [Cinara cedri]|uniref:Lysosomal transcription factor, NCU-G1 n=1 Tax=Cinara cedri TaxID=506608 RepID=A0A5E4MFY0_9HEMI|nr:Lysosomal transcription factor, NCU-G1 [Cinara cedri]
MNMPKSIIFIFMVFISLANADRKLHAEFNPGCKVDHCSSLNLAYIRSDGDNDTVHFLFDFTEKPSLVILTSAKDSVIKVNYTATIETLKFTKTPLYTFATVFNNLYEFNDVNDTAKIENGENIITMNFNQFNWKLISLKNYDNKSVEVNISSKYFRAPGIEKHGNVSITLKIYGEKGIGSKLPCLTHTPESGELTITLDQLKTNFTKSRFAVELLSLSSFPFNKSEEISVDTFSDDKLSGGTFLNYLVTTKGDDKEGGGGYLSWKPVMYKAADTHALNSSSTNQYAVLDHFDVKDWTKTPLFTMFNNSIFDHSYLLKATNVSFGQPNDDFYRKSNYLYWTFLVGVGAPPHSRIGFLELSIIASLLLMSTITMIIMFCVFMRWVSSKRNSIIYGQ